MAEKQAPNSGPGGPWIGYCNTCGHVGHFSNWDALWSAKCVNCGEASDGNGYCWCEGCLADALAIIERQLDQLPKKSCAVCAGIAGPVYGRDGAYLDELKIGADGCCQFCTVDKH